MAIEITPQESALYREQQEGLEEAIREQDNSRIAASEIMDGIPIQPIPPYETAQFQNAIDAVQQDIARQLGMNATTERAIMDSKPPEPPKKKCTIEQALPSSVISLIEAMPHNDTVRALILAHLKMECPKEADTFNKIRDWIEFNIEAPKKPNPIPVGIDGIPTLPRPPRAVISIGVEGSERETGRCRYSLTRSGEGTYEIAEAELMDIASECDSLDGVIDFLVDRMNDDGVYDNVNMETVEGSEDYHDHDSGDSDGFEWSFSNRTRMRGEVFAAIRRNSPDEYARLNGDDQDGE